MTAISRYYAEVGVGLDMKSLRRTQDYLKRIEKMMLSFKKRIERQQTLTYKVKLDQAAMFKQVQSTVNRVGRSTTVTLKKFDIDGKSLSRSMNKTLKNSSFFKNMTMNIRLSNRSLNDMRRQIRFALEGTVIRPKINPSVTNSVSGGRSPSSGGGGHRNPMHNPMMIGGGAGSLMRYGAFALPFIGGVYGLNAMNNFASLQAAQKTSLDMVTAMSTSGVTSADHQKFIRGLAAQTGKTTMGMTPIYTQMLAASQGTELESQMPDMFSGIMQYASVMGLGEESIKRAMTGFQQMIGKRTIMAEELKGQVGEHIPTVIPLMAKAMGMDVKTLFKTMEKGELDPMTALPKLAKLMAEMSAPAMGAFQQSLPYKQGMAQVHQETWMKNFNESGGLSGLTRFWDVWGHIIKSSESSAVTLGKVFEKAAWQFSRMILLGTELKEWLGGDDDSRNIWQRWFGDSSSNQIIDSATQMFKELNATILETHKLTENLFDTMKFSIDNKVLAGLRKLMESFVTINKMFFYAYTGQFGKVGETFSNASNRFAQIDREKNAADSAEAFMVDTYGSDKSNWPKGEYTKRYNAERVKNDSAYVDSVLQPTTQTSSASFASRLYDRMKTVSGAFSLPESIRSSPIGSDVKPQYDVPTADLPSGGGRLVGGGISQVSYANNSKIEITVSGTSVENAKQIEEAVKSAIKKTDAEKLNDINNKVGRVPQ